MDWLPIIFLLLFFLWPILESVLRGKQGEDTPPMQDDDAWSRVPGERDEWSSWPEDEGSFAEEMDVEPQRAPQSATAPAPQPVAARQPEPDMKSFLAPDAEEIRRASARLRQETVSLEAPSRQRRRAGGAQLEVARTLRTPSGFRKAVVMAEILGPPRSLKPKDGDN